MTVAERVEALNTARHTLIQAATGLVVIGGVVFTALGLWYTARTVEATQEGQITDRYTKAVEQLGSTRQDVRLGGIYALQRLANDSPRDRDTVRNVLAAYVRGHDFCALPAGQKELSKACAAKNWEGLVKKPLIRPGADVLAALTIAADLSPRTMGVRFDAIGTVADLRTVADFSQVRFPRADLRGTNLHNVNVRGAALYGADFSSTDMSSAILSSANLSGANLRIAILSRADMSSANLNRTNLNNANLNNANLNNANLNDALLRGADLSSANLSSADMSSAILGFADLSGAKVNGAKLSRADLSSANLNGADLSYADLRGADLGGAVLYGADLRGADLRRANLNGAVLRGADLRDIHGKTEKEIRAVTSVDSGTQFGSLPWPLLY